MKTKNKANKLLILAVILLLSSTIAYAKPFTEGFKNVLVLINDFFAKEQWKPYSTTIDFFIFSLLFIFIYMRGVRFAFKEVTKPEKAIAVLLGLTTAFLLVLQEFSVIALLPYVHWILYFLIFLFWWKVLGLGTKSGGEKSK